MLFIAMGMLGMGNGAVFQIAPQRFPADIELMTGIVGAAGGLGGFFLPSVIGALKDMTGSFGVGLLCFAALVLFGALLLLEFGVQWSFRWSPDALRQTMVFSYRNPRRASLQDGALSGEMNPAEE
jgi:NNP family nitrate/nitrite transporter-like MFS transporter